MKRLVLLFVVVFSPHAFGEGAINAIGCKVYLPDNYEGYYRADGSLTFSYGGSSINLSKFSGYLKGGIVGNDELSIKEFKSNGLNVVIGKKENRVTKSAVDIVQITDGVTKISIIGDMAKDWEKIIRDCDRD